VPRCETLGYADSLAATPKGAIPEVSNPRVDAGPASNEVSACGFIARDEYIVALAAKELIEGMVLPQRSLDEFILTRIAVDVVGAKLAVQLVVAAQSVD
jgi:hypothetical protein